MRRWAPGWLCLAADRGVAEHHALHEILLRSLRDTWDPPQLRVAFGGVALQCDVWDMLVDPHASVAADLAGAMELTPTAHAPPHGVAGPGGGARAAKAAAAMPKALFHRAPDPFANAPVRVTVTQVVKADGVCESVLYGAPMLLRPSTSYALPWGELETHQHTFQALAEWLAREVGLAWPAADGPLGSLTRGFFPGHGGPGCPARRTPGLVHAAPSAQQRPRHRHGPACQGIGAPAVSLGRPDAS